MLQNGIPWEIQVLTKIDTSREVLRNLCFFDSAQTSNPVPLIDGATDELRHMVARTVLLLELL